MADEKVFANVKFTPKTAAYGVVVFALFYVILGIVVGRFVREWIGMLWIAVGAALLVVAAWRSFFPPVIIATRDGIRIEGQNRKPVFIGYERIHDARWEVVSPIGRKVFGPLFFFEPVWFLQRPCRRHLVIMYSGDPLAFDEDEYAGLDELGAVLKKHDVPGFADKSKRPLFAAPPGGE